MADLAAAADLAAGQVGKGLDRTGRVLAMAAGVVAASLSELNNAGVDAVLRGGDALGQACSYLESRSDLPWLARFRSTADCHLQALIAAAQTPEFWQRTLGHALEASVYSAAITAVDQLLVHRDALLNGTVETRQQILLQILQTSGLMAAGALPVSVFLGVALTLVPGLAAVMGPLGVIGSASLGVRLLSSAVRHPSRQERRALQQVQGLLQELIYALQRDSDGNLIITVKAQPAS
jgi:hypothetical protein